jgi:hypothetical protein
MSSPSMTGFQLKAEAEELKASSERPRKQVKALLALAQPVWFTTVSKWAWYAVEIGGNVEVNEVPDSRMPAWKSEVSVSA